MKNISGREYLASVSTNIFRLLFFESDPPLMMMILHTLIFFVRSQRRIQKTDRDCDVTIFMHTEYIRVKVLENLKGYIFRFICIFGIIFFFQTLIFIVCFHVICHTPRCSRLAAHLGLLFLRVKTISS